MVFVQISVVAYFTDNESTIHVSGSVPEFGEWREDRMVKMNSLTSDRIDQTAPKFWEIVIEIDDSVEEIEYRFVRLRNGEIEIEGAGPEHKRKLILRDKNKVR